MFSIHLCNVCGAISRLSNGISSGQIHDSPFQKFKKNMGREKFGQLGGGHAPESEKECEPFLLCDCSLLMLECCSIFQNDLKPHVLGTPHVKSLN